MRKKFHEIYEVLYSEYIYENSYRGYERIRPYPHPEHYMIKRIRVSIDKADKKNSLRPDAKYFLLVNFHHLIVRPLFEQLPYRENFYHEIEYYIDSDIATIVSETKKEAEQDEISGHQIMRTIDRLWESLKTTRLEIWG